MGEGKGVWMYRCREVVERLSKGGRADLGSMYVPDSFLSLSFADHPILRRHIIEIPLVFNTSSLWKEGSHEALSSVAFGDRWVRFAATGNPGTLFHPSFSLLCLLFSNKTNPINLPLRSPPPDPEWKPFTPETPNWLAFGTGGKAENEDLKEFEQNMVQFGDRK